MSVQIYPKVLLLPIPARAKLILAVLGDFANTSGLAWPSQALLGFKASISPRNLRSNLKKLQEDGWLQIYPRARTGGVNLYQLNLEKISRISHEREAQIKKEKEARRVNNDEQYPTTINTVEYDPTITVVYDSTSRPDDQDNGTDVGDSYRVIGDTATGCTEHVERMPASSRTVNNRQESQLESSREPSVSPTVFKESYDDNILAQEAKSSILDRVRRWAELENSEPEFSDIQKASLMKALKETCNVVCRPDLIFDIQSWDFLSESSKNKWYERIDAQFSQSTS